MTLDIPDILSGAAFIGTGVAGWFLRELWDTVKRLQSDQRSIEHDLHTHFARKDDLRDAFNDLLTALRRIEDKLDGKVDKP